MVPYLGVAVHGLPNQFFVTGPDAARAEALHRACLNAMARTGSTRIEVRHSTQRTYTDPVPSQAAQSTGDGCASRSASAFDLSSHIGVDDELYDGAGHRASATTVTTSGSA